MLFAALDKASFEKSLDEIVGFTRGFFDVTPLRKVSFFYGLLGV